MPSAEKFLDILEEKDLLAGDVLRALRKRVAASVRPVTPDAIARQLVQAGHLTPALAERLLASALAQEGPAAGAAAEGDDLGLAPLEEEKKKPAAPAAAEGKKEKEEEEDLGLAPLPEEKTAKPKPAPAPAQQPAKPREPETPAKPREAEKAAKPKVAEKTAKPKVAEKPAKPKEEAAGAKPPSPAPPAAAASLLDEELGALDAAVAPGALDSLMSASVLDAATASPLAPVAARKKGPLAGLFGRKARPVRRARGWDSPLMLVGGGALLLFLIAGGALFLTLRRESGDLLLKPADDDYESGSYTQAITKYKDFLDRFPNHPRASRSRVRRGLAQIRQAVEGGANWPKALETATEVLGEIAAEDDFREAHSELASLLPAIAKGLADDAAKAPDAATVALSHETLAMVDKYVLKSLQNKVVLDEVRASLAITSRGLAREAELDRAVAAMKAALAEGKTGAAYEVRYALVKQYPDLATSEKLGAMTAEVSKAQQAAVRFVEAEQAAEREEAPSPTTAEVALAACAGAEAPGARGHVVFAAFKGVTYALDAGTGRLLWRRATGPGAYAPTPVSAAPESDVLVADAARRELLRLEGATGRLRWRHALGRPVEAPPAMAKGRALAATAAGEGGTLHLIDLETGAASGRVELPQPVRVAPVVDSRRDAVYLVAEHSNLFVLSLAGGQCKEVVHLGHEPGGITAPPAAVANFLVLAENHKIDRSMLKVLAAEADGQGGFRLVQQDELPGHVDTAPLVSGRRLAVVTDCGAVRVYEISGTNVKQPLAKVAERGAEGPRDLVRFPLLSGAQLWTAGDQLARFDVQTAMGQLTLKAVSDKDAGDVFLQAPVLAGDVLVHVRYRPGAPGVLVSAVDVEAGKRVWQARLGVPPAGELAAEASPPGVSVVNAAGDVFKVEAGALKGRTVAGAPAAAIDPAQQGETPRALGHCAVLPGGALVLSAAEGADRWFVFDPKAGGAKWAAAPLPGPLSCGPVPFGDGLLAPLAAGWVAWLDPRTGAERTGPFQPALAPGETLRWRLPAVLEDGKEFVVADGARRLYRVGAKETPKPHLEALAEADLPGNVAAPVAVLGSVVWVVDEAGRLAAFTLPELERTEVGAVSGRCVWGPARAGSHVVLATDEGRVLLLDGQKKVAADLAFEYGPLAGAPLEWDGGYLLASARGILWHVRPAAEGRWEETGRVDAGLPLASGPAVLEKRVVVAAHDGALYALPLPEKPKPDGPKPNEP